MKMEVKVKGKDLFRKILTIQHPFKPEIENFSFQRDEGIIHFKNPKELSKKDREFVEAGYSYYGLYFSSKDLIFPDIIDRPEEKRFQDNKNYNLFFWQERFPEKWKDFLKKPLFLFVPEKKVKGFTAVSKFFHIENVILGKKVFYFNIKKFPEKPFEVFLELKGEEKWDLFILDHLSSADQVNFEKFLFFILKAPYEGYEIVATQWPGKKLPQGDFVEIPRFSYSEFLKIFHFPFLKREEFFNLIEENLEKYDYFPSNLVEVFLKKKEPEESILSKSKEKRGSADKEKLKQILMNGELFKAYPYLEEIRKRKQLYELFLAWQGDWETLLLILKKPAEELLPLLFLLGWDGFMEIERLRAFLPEEIYFLLENRKENFLERLKEILEKNERISFYLKLIYADKSLSSGFMEAENILRDMEKRGKKMKPFEEAQLNRFLSYYNFYKGNLEKAIEFNKKWIEISERNGWLWQMPLAFNDLAVLFMEKKDYEGARKSAQTALNFSFLLPEEKKEGTISFNLAVILTYLEEFEKAKEIFKKLEKIHREKGDYYSLAFDLYEISRVLYLQGELEEGLKYIKQAEEIIKNFPHHPRFFQIWILKTKLILWFSREEYKNSLDDLKNFKNYPPHLKLEIEEILSEGALRGFINYKFISSDNIEFERRIKEGNLKGTSFYPDSIEKAIKVLEWNLFYPEKLPEQTLKNAIEFIERKNLQRWRLNISEKKSAYLPPIFEIFGEKEFSFERIPFDFKLVLKDGSVIEKGKGENFYKILIPEDTWLFLPEELALKYSEEVWRGWVYAILYKKEEREGIEINFPENLQNFNGFYFSSYKMQKIVEKAKKIAGIDIPVHIYGETGTGKEILAKAIHQESKRFYGPFVPVNCSAIPENLFESEFFGWKKGAFSGALMDRAGYFEQANRGTLFLDEIGELPLNLQAKLLRVIQEKEIQPLGDVQRKKVDFRLITATNKDLKKMVEEGKFREDLYYRIVVGFFKLPPLRERKEEIKPLASLIIQKNIKNFGIKNCKIDPIFLKALEKKEWKGNVRELENYIIALLANMDEGGTLTLKEEFLPEKEEAFKFKGTYHQLVASFKKEIIEEAMKRAGNSRKEAAKILGITPQALGYILKELKMVK